MDRELLSTDDAAARLGIARASLYDLLAQSNASELVIAGHSVTIEHFQTGPAGRGRIRIPAAEVDRLLALMRVVPSQPIRHRPPRRQQDELSFIRVPLGRPAD